MIILVKRIPVVMENVNAILLSEKQRRNIWVKMGFSVGNSGLISPTWFLHRRREVETIYIYYMLEVGRNKKGHKELVNHLQPIQSKNGKQCRHSHRIALWLSFLCILQKKASFSTGQVKTPESSSCSTWTSRGASRSSPTIKLKKNPTQKTC